MVPTKTFAGVVAMHLTERRPVDLFTVIRSGEALRFPVGAKLVCPDGVAPAFFGIGTAEGRALCAQLPKTASKQQVGVKTVTIVPGLNLDLACERLLPPLQCVIAGAGHIGTALAEIGVTLGWQVVAADDRADFAAADRFDSAVKVVCSPFADLWDRVAVCAQTAVVLVTRGHTYDEACLRRLALSPAFYVGMIGSRRRIATVRRRMREEGVSEAWLDRLYAPIGLPVGAETPGEIALAVAAEITGVLRGRGDWAQAVKQEYYHSK